MEKVYYILIATGEPLQRSYQHPNKLAKYDDAITTVLSKVDMNKDHKRTLSSPSISIHYMVLKGTLFLLICDSGLKIRMAFAMLEELEHDYSHRTISNRGAMKEKFKQFNDMGRRTRMDKLENIHNKVDNIKDVMVENIDKVIENLEHYDIMVGKSSDIKDTSEYFARGSKKARDRKSVV